MSHDSHRSQDSRLSHRSHLSQNETSETSETSETTGHAPLARHEATKSPGMVILGAQGSASKSVVFRDTRHYAFIDACMRLLPFS